MTSNVDMYNKIKYKRIQSPEVQLDHHEVPQSNPISSSPFPLTERIPRLPKYPTEEKRSISV